MHWLGFEGMHCADLELMKEFALLGQRGVPPGQPMPANDYMQIFFCGKKCSLNIVWNLQYNFWDSLAIANTLPCCHKPQVIIKEEVGRFFYADHQTKPEWERFGGFPRPWENLAEWLALPSKLVVISSGVTFSEETDFIKTEKQTSLVKLDCFRER